MLLIKDLHSTNLIRLSLFAVKVPNFFHFIAIILDFVRELSMSVSPLLLVNLSHFYLILYPTPQFQGWLIVLFSSYMYETNQFCNTFFLFLYPSPSLQFIHIQGNVFRYPTEINTWISALFSHGWNELSGPFNPLSLTLFSLVSFFLSSFNQG